MTGTDEIPDEPREIPDEPRDETFIARAGEVSTVVARQARACLGWPGCFPAGREQLVAYASRYHLPAGLLRLLAGLPGGRTWAGVEQMLREPGPVVTVPVPPLPPGPGGVTPRA